MTSELFRCLPGASPEVPDGSMLLGELVLKPHWMASAACRNTPREWFFPERYGDVSGARALCSGCPVLGDCLAYALDDEDLDGIWGGLTTYERRRLRAQALPGDGAEAAAVAVQ